MMCRWVEWLSGALTFVYLRHQDPEGTLGIHYACDAIYALLQTPFAFCDEYFLLQVSYLGVPVMTNLYQI